MSPMFPPHTVCAHQTYRRISGSKAGVIILQTTQTTSGMGRLHLGLGALGNLRKDERLEVDDDTLLASLAPSWLLILAR